MNGIHINEYYAQERINARLREAENHRLARQTRQENNPGVVIGAAASQVNYLVGQLAGRVANQLVHSLHALGQVRVASFWS